MKSILLLVVLLGALLVPVHAQNYVVNSGFEKGTTSWSWAISGSAAATCSVDLTQIHWEEKAVQLHNDSAYASNVYGCLRQTLSGLITGNTYYVSLWCKGTAVGTHNQIAVGKSWQFRKTLPSGTFDWTLVQYSFVADATSIPLLILIQDPTTSLWIDDVYVTDNPVVNVASLGISGNGADITTALRAAIQSNRFLYLPAGTYVVSSAISVPANTILWGAGSSTILSNSSGTGYTFTVTGTDAAAASGLEWSGLRFTGANTQVALLLKKAQNVLIRNCQADYSGLVKSDITKTGYGSITAESDLNSTVRIACNTISSPNNSNSGSTITGICLPFTVDATVYKNTVSYTRHGISWWGGDSNYSVNGAATNPRWARRIAITSNTVSHIIAGGIWGAMGQNITVKTNTVSDCGDNGIDFEGGIDCLADSNTVSDGQHGCLTIYYYASNVTFSNNIVSTSDATWPLFIAQNSSTSSNLVLSEATLTGNTFSGNSVVGVLSDGYGPVSLTVTNNTFTNAIIDITHNQTGSDVYSPVVTGNTLTYTTDVPDTLTAIYVRFTYDDAVVSGNTITYQGATQSNKRGIFVRCSNPSNTANITLNNNTVIGCQLADLYVIQEGGSHLTTTINSNVVQYSKIYAKKQNADNMTISSSGNKNTSGAAVAVTWLTY